MPVCADWYAQPANPPTAIAPASTVARRAVKRVSSRFFVTADMSDPSIGVSFTNQPPGSGAASASSMISMRAISVA